MLTRTQNQNLKESKRLEGVLILQRWLYVPAGLIVGWLYSWPNVFGLVAILVGLIIVNIAGYHVNKHILSIKSQRALGFFMLAVDFFAGTALIFILNPGSSMLFYIIFSLIIIEAAVRYELRGALIMDLALGLVMLAGIYFLPFPGLVSFPLADFLLILGVMSFGSLMVGMVAREWRKQRKYSEKLAAERALLLERRRISSELHDSILKSLQGLSLEAYSLTQDSKGAGNAFSEKTNYIQEVCQLLSRQIRSVIMELRIDDINKEEGPSVYINNLIDAWAKRIHIEVERNIPSTFPPLEPQFTHHLYNIISEALLNIERHADASKVWVKITIDSGEMIIELEDNGHGFYSEQENLYSYLKQGKVGLVSIKERVEVYGGTFQIQNSPDGAKLYISMPFKENWND
jgi:signal transduction histidine kinase